MLHNFAANNEMYGVLDAIAIGPIKARSSYNSTMIGVGMCMEGIEQNPIVYDLMSEMAFRHDPVDVEEWLLLYSTRRYGKQIKGLKDAWKILLRTLYNCTDGAYNKNRDVIVAFPDVEPSVILNEEAKLHETSPTNNFLVRKLPEGNLQDDNSDVAYEKPHLWYSTADVIHALRIFLENGGEVSDIPTFRYDLVDLTRQALAKYTNEVFQKALEGYRSNDLTKVNFHSRHFLDLVEDLDTLLTSHDGFLLGPWLESAKNLATDSDQKEQFEWNARTQITMWYDNLETEASLLRDYGNKYWSGLLRDYYGPRAKIYFECLSSSMQTGKPFSLQDWRRDWISLTNSWQKSREVYPVQASGDTYSISQWIFDKYLSRTGSYLQYDHSVSSF
ncbi:hypothetical protein LUZ61_001944 [Rhynchospora tenuis]|uniref:Alpha-N-acetylglucosaminidase n=1 Tax=Rhynchospora tenuis TaxID=198213 RepID=A0AAD5ZHZ3_9POAL|nr:hypothetical protein LUZ61_001944 [Rhynchospora tenuis]